MKKLLFIFFLLFGLQQSEAQITNPGFEQWDSSGQGQIYPHGWPDLANKYLRQSTNSTEGRYALTVCVWYYYVKTNASQYTAINYRPAAFSGQYTYTDNTLMPLSGTGVMTDTALISIYLTHWDAAAGRRDTVGIGTLPLMATASYSSFYCPVHYISATMPDSMLVIADPSIIRRYVNQTTHNTTSNNGYGSFLTIDALNIEQYPAGLETIEGEPDILVFPNPATDKVQLKTQGSPAQYISITDALGRECFTKEIISKEEEVSVQALSEGLYFINLYDKNSNRLGIKSFVKN